MEQKTVCPLRVMASEAGNSGWGPVDVRRTACLGSLCAWWDAARECCAVLEAVKRLRALSK